MPTPTIDKLRIYYPSKYLTADGDDLTQFAVDSADKRNIVCSALTQADDYFAGALGWFDGNTITPELRGIFFHIKQSVQSGNTLTLSRDLPIAPQAGDTFRLVIGGLYRSSQETFGMKLGGVLPELEPVACVNITDVTIKKASNTLGEGDLHISYDHTLQQLYIKIDDGNYGVGLDVSSSSTDAIIFTEGDTGYIQVDVDSAQLPASDAEDIFTLVYPQAVFTPDFEGYETANGAGGKVRYRLEVIKNTDPADIMVDLSVYTARPTGSSTTISTGGIDTSAGYIDVADASDWPVRSFWIKNLSANSGAGDCRYVKYRSGNRLYLEAAGFGLRGYSAVSWSVGDTVEPMADIDIGLQEPDSNNQFADIPDEITAPAGVTFTDISSKQAALYIGDLEAGKIYGIWRRETILNNHRARKEVIGDTIYTWS